MLLIKDTLYLNSNNNFKIGTLVIEGQKIKSISEDISDFDQENVSIINGSGFLVLPGLMNSHTHISMVLFRGFAEDLTLQDWLHNKILPLELKLNQDLVFYGALMGIAELLHSGCTFFADMYFFMDAVAKAVSISGIRANLSLGLIDKNDQSGLDQTKEFYNSFHGSAEERIQVFVGPHAPYTCNQDYLEKISRLASDLKTGIHIHLNETETEVNDYVHKHKTRPIVAMKNLGLFESPIIAAHCVHVNDEEIDILRRNNVLVVHNPSSNMKLASGISPVDKMLAHGVKISLGTDGAASNNQLNLFKEMHMASLLSKVSKKDACSLPADAVFSMATETPANYFLGSHSGTIKEGNIADLILIDLEKANLFPHKSINKSIIHSIQGAEVHTVIINGKIIMQNHIIQTFDETETRNRANELLSGAFQ